jgi:hypothetical protein
VKQKIAHILDGQVSLSDQNISTKMHIPNMAQSLCFEKGKMLHLNFKHTLGVIA